jgi:hypothetical protein
MTDPEDVEGCTTIIESIEACWATADQEIFIAAVVLNPFYQSMPFALLLMLEFSPCSVVFGNTFMRKNHRLNSTSKSMVICMVPIYSAISNQLVG